MPENFRDITVDATDDEDAVHRLGGLVEEELGVGRGTGGEDGAGRGVGVVDLPAGRALRVVGPTSLDLHVVLPGGTGYLTLSSSAPVVGMTRDTVRLRPTRGRSRDRGAVTG